MDWKTHCTERHYVKDDFTLIKRTFDDVPDSIYIASYTPDCEVNCNLAELLTGSGLSEKEALNELWHIINDLDKSLQQAKKALKAALDEKENKVEVEVSPVRQPVAPLIDAYGNNKYWEEVLSKGPQC